MATQPISARLSEDVYSGMAKELPRFKSRTDCINDLLRAGLQSRNNPAPQAAPKVQYIPVPGETKYETKYVDRIKTVEKPVYIDKPVEKVVYRDKIVKEPAPIAGIPTDDTAKVVAGVSTGVVSGLGVRYLGKRFGWPPALCNFAGLMTGVTTGVVVYNAV